MAVKFNVRQNDGSPSVAVLAMLILGGLPASKSNVASALLDEIQYWLTEGYRGSAIQDSLEWLWGQKLVQTDDLESPPIYPRASVIFRSEKGDSAAASSQNLSSRA
ncbi:hypothetical protein NKJ06_26130 [Mesorhizobium sp. M0293]|uniref:hypothetical protein n=1 Tax=Mesorhizobium sp. M0293 TaxID=2956930 RepID=UPI0033356558